MAGAPGLERSQIPRALVYLAIGAMVLGLTAQRSFFPHRFWTFWVFRASFWHLIRGQNLYARYGSHDIFKYSPTVALLFAPFAWPSYPVGLLFWNAFNAAALVVAMKRVVKRDAEVLALLLVLPELFISMQASQSNSLVAALILTAFVAFEARRQFAAVVAIALGVAIKIFPVVALSFALFHPRRGRAASYFALCAVTLFLLPLAVTSPAMLLTQYGWWRGVEATDANALGASVMHIMHQTLGVTWPSWPVQLAGAAVLLLPLVQRERWTSRHFRLTYLASLMIFVVIFNHQAERPSFIIAAAGVAIWFVESSRDRFRLSLALLSLTGLLAWGFLPVWVMIQCELHGVLDPQSRLLFARPRHSPTYASFEKQPSQDSS